MLPFSWFAEMWPQLGAEPRAKQSMAPLWALGSDEQLSLVTVTGVAVTVNSREPCLFSWPELQGVNK